MINPAQYNRVLSQATDEQLMNMLRRPDKIPSQFIVAEINRRQSMRQASKAQQAGMAEQMATNPQPQMAQLPEAMQSPSQIKPTGLFRGGPSRVPTMTLGERNMNPLNIRPNDQFFGSTGQNQGYATFVAPLAGLRAGSVLLDTYANEYGIDNVDSLIDRFAPAGDNASDSRTNYKSFVADALGVGVNDNIDLTDDATKATVLDAQIKFENNGKNNYSSLIPQAIKLSKDKTNNPFKNNNSGITNASFSSPFASPGVSAANQTSNIMQTIDNLFASGDRASLEKLATDKSVPSTHGTAAQMYARRKLGQLTVQSNNPTKPPPTDDDNTDTSAIAALRSQVRRDMDTNRSRLSTPMGGGTDDMGSADAIYGKMGEPKDKSIFKAIRNQIDVDRSGGIERLADKKTTRPSTPYTGGDDNPEDSFLLGTEAQSSTTPYADLKRDLKKFFGGNVGDMPPVKASIDDYKLNQPRPADTSPEKLFSQTRSKPNKAAITTADRQLLEREVPNDEIANTIVKETNSSGTSAKTSFNKIANNLKASATSNSEISALNYNQIMDLPLIKNMGEANQAIVDEYNKGTADLVEKRKDLMSLLDSQRRTPQNMMFKSLIDFGLELAASPETNFLTAVAKAGQKGISSFDNLATQDKKQLFQKYKMAYDIASDEMGHKMKGRELATKLNSQLLTVADTLSNIGYRSQMGQAAVARATNVKQPNFNTLIAADMKQYEPQLEQAAMDEQARKDLARELGLKPDATMEMIRSKIFNNSTNRVRSGMGGTVYSTDELINTAGM